MSKKVNEVISYFENLYNTKSIYLWGCNSEIITKELCNKLYKTYGSSTYNKTYYDNKFKEGQGKIGADCSGAFYPMSGFDTTAQGYYNKCSSKGVISSINRNKPCLVFKGKSVSAINHIGFYLGDGYVIEMKSSKENCVKDKLDDKGWKWFGIPTWIDYSSSPSTTNNTQYTYAIDVSSYQGVINWAQVKSSGIKYAILRGVTKNGEMDTTFESNYTNAIKNGVKIIGVYQFSYAIDETTAVKDAKNMIAKLNGKKIDIYLDLEWATQRALGKSKVTAIAKAYVNTCKSLGYNCHIYSNLDWYKNAYDSSELKALGCKFWIARYSATDNGTVKEHLKPNVGEYIWQFSSKGKINGINGNVDFNIIYGQIEQNTQNNSSANSVTETKMDVLGKITANKLNVRQEPNATSAILNVYSKNQLVHVLAKTSNEWYKTNDGYISGKYVENALGQVINCNKLNMRKEPNSSSNNVITVLNVGEVLTLMGVEDNWYKVINVNNIVGYVSAKYIQIL